MYDILRNIVRTVGITAAPRPIFLRDVGHSSPEGLFSGIDGCTVGDFLGTAANSHSYCGGDCRPRPSNNFLVVLLAAPQQLLFK